MVPGYALRRLTSFLAVLASAAFLSANSLESQQTAVLAGVVKDTAGLALQAAEITAVRGGFRALSDSRGLFLLGGIRKGRELIQVRRIGYLSQVFELEVEGADTLRVAVTLARDSVQHLPEISVNAPRPPTPDEELERQAYERVLSSAAPVSSILSRAELASAGDSPLRLLLAKHGMRLGSKRGQGSGLSCKRGGRPTFYLEGAQVDFGQIDIFSPRQIELIEVYASRTARPSQFSIPGSGCTILIWLRR